MSDIEQRVIEDEYGTLTQIMSARGNWKNWSRTMDGVTFMVHPGRRTVDTLLAFKAGGISFRLNDLSDRVEVMGDDELLPDKHEPVSDITEAVILNWLADIGLTGKERLTQAIKQSAAMNRYNPIIEYFEGLEWDGKDHFAALMSYITFDRKTDVFAQKGFKRFMIGAVAKVSERGQNFMLVLDGLQGLGKSFFARFLCPLPTLFVEGAIKPDDKDSYIRLIENFLWEVGELEGITRKVDRAGLKDFITRREVTVRKPFGTYDIVKPASASHIGTINEDGAGFLNDPTGSRRFVVVKVTSIDRAYSKEIDIDQVWAQIYFMYKSGETWHLEEDEEKTRVAINETYEAVDPIDGRLRQLYDFNDTEGDNFTSSIEILQIMKDAGMGGQDKPNSMYISSALRKAGYEKGRKNGQHGFMGLKSRQIDINGDYANL